MAREVGQNKERCGGMSDREVSGSNSVLAKRALELSSILIEFRSNYVDNPAADGVIKIFISLEMNSGATAE